MFSVFYGIAAPLMALAPIGNVPFLTDNPILADMYDVASVFEAYLTDPLDYQVRRNGRIYDVTAPVSVSEEFLTERERYLESRDFQVTYDMTSSYKRPDAKKLSEAYSLTQRDIPPKLPVCTSTDIPTPYKPYKVARVFRVTKAYQVPKGYPGVVDIGGTRIPYIYAYGVTVAPPRTAGIWKGSGDVDDGEQSWFIGHNPGVFWRVATLVVGDVVTIHNASGSRSYRIVKYHDFPKDTSYYYVRDNYISGYGESIVVQTCVPNAYRVMVATPI